MSLVNPISQEMKDYMYLEDNGHWPDGKMPDWMGEYAQNPVWKVMALKLAYEAELVARQRIAPPRPVTNQLRDCRYFDKHGKWPKDRLPDWVDSESDKSPQDQAYESEIRHLNGMIRDLEQRMDLMVMRPGEGY